MTYRIGIDVGGTFTDLVAISEDGITTIAKAPTTTDDQSRGVLNGLADLAERLDLTVGALLEQCTQIVHGTTVATNALLERKGAKVGLLTTHGHRDVLEMHEGLKPDRYNLRMTPPEPLVPRNLRLGIPERVSHDGSVIEPLDERAVIAALDQLREAGVESVAIAYLHSYRNPTHEQRTAQLVAEHLPNTYCSISSDVLPQIKEYERFSTTIVNSYVGPALRKYLTSLDTRLTETGFKGELFVVLSHGGIARIQDAIRLGAATVLSGPAGGIVGAQLAAKFMECGNVLPFDMGGTSTEISLIVDGKTSLSSERGVAGARVALRSFDILSIGAGGGSLGHVDTTGRFGVGPESAGAWPGPVCYGRGGSSPTVTDANLLLGYLDPENFRGGRATLDVDSTEIAMTKLGIDLGMGSLEAAEGIFRLINVKMADGFRLMTIRRGVDPRRFTLLAFGGAAGIHATSVAREIGISRVIVPQMSSVLSAWGMLASNLRYELARSHLIETSKLSDADLANLINDLASEAAENSGFSPELLSRADFEYSAEMRYGDQIFEIDVPLQGTDTTGPGLVNAVEHKFHRRHEELFTYSSPSHPVELVNLRVVVVVPSNSKIAGSTLLNERLKSAPPRRRLAVITGRKCMVDVYHLESLSVDQVIIGPALIESENTSVLLLDNDRAQVAANHWLDISIDSIGSHTQSDVRPYAVTETEVAEQINDKTTTVVN